MRRTRQFEIVVALVLAFVITACGASARQKTIRITYESINIACDRLVEFTKIHGKAIVDEAFAAGKTKEQTRDELDAFLVKIDHASLTCKGAYRMVAAASVVNDDRSVSALVQVAALLMAELKELKVIK